MRISVTITLAALPPKKITDASMHPISIIHLAAPCAGIGYRQYELFAPAHCSVISVPGMPVANRQRA